jgi:hydroxyethylthiazole kinase-like uncharacterized protein yjeF
MKIVTAAEMRTIDRVTIERFRVPSLTLMENAGSAVAMFVLRQYPAAQRISVICGKGNNGGDGLVAARKLREAGKSVAVVLLTDSSELSGDAAAMFARLPVTAMVAQSSEELNSDRVRPALDADLYIDAILGTGFRPPVSRFYASAIAVLNPSRVPIVAVDIPSGADADRMGEATGTVARADAIVTFTAPRPAHLFSRLTQGPTVVANIGSPDEAMVSSLQLNLITARDVAPLIGPRPADSNKGLYGHVLVIGGSLGKAGAPAMSGIAALRAGAGLSTVATPKSVLGTVAGFYPELMTEPLAETQGGTISVLALKGLDPLAEKKSVLAIGPGVSRHPQTAKMVRSLVVESQIPMVVDADGLNAFEGHSRALNGKKRTLVITPHPGEMARLIGGTTGEVQKDRLGVARKFARQHALVVVLKGHQTLVVGPDGQAWVNMTGNPGMATAGTGDVLTGMVAAMMAQHPQAVIPAIVAAVHLHGLAGDVMRESRGEHSLVATDLLEGLPEAFRRTWQAAQEKFVRWGA